MRHKYKKQYKFPKNPGRRVHYQKPLRCIETGGAIYFTKYCVAISKYYIHTNTGIKNVSFRASFPRNRISSAFRSLKVFYKNLVKRYGKKNVIWR